MKSMIKRMFPVYNYLQHRPEPAAVKFHLLAKDASQADEFIRRNGFDRSEYKFVQKADELDGIYNVTVILFQGISLRQDILEISRRVLNSRFRNVKFVSVEDFIASLN